MQLLLYYIILITTYCKNEELERKYFQKDLTYTLNRLVINSYNKEIIEYISAITFKYNRTTTFVNGSITVLVDINKWKGRFIGYKLSVGEYKRTAIEFNIDLCRALTMNTFGLVTLFKKHGNVKDCPMKKGRYHFHNFYLMSDQLPPGWPPGEWKLEVNSTLNGIFAYVVSLHFTVEYPFIRTKN